jgi:hypothetical protein
MNTLHQYPDIVASLEWYAAWKADTLKRAGPRIVKDGTANRSLRELSRLSGFSPTYLSLVKNRRQTISSAAFIALARIVGADYDPRTPSAHDAPSSLQGAGAGSPAGSRRRLGDQA